MVFHWSLSDSKFPQVSRTLLSIVAVLNNAVVLMVSKHPPTSKSSSPFNNPLVTVLKAPITIGIIVTLMLHSFFNSLAGSRYLSFFSHSFSFIMWSAETAKSTNHYYYYYYYHRIEKFFHRDRLSLIQGLYSILALWARTHFGRPYCLIHNAGRVCHGFCGSRKGYLKWLSKKLGIRVTWLRPTLIGPQGGFPSKLSLDLAGLQLQATNAPLTRRMPGMTGPWPNAGLPH